MTVEVGAPGHVDNPMDEHGFADAMARLEPFEPSPSVAVAVSGGPDSMALCLLADRWARARRGAVLALTVDHGLRAESAREAETVAGWLEDRGIAHRVLRWCGHDGPGQDRSGQGGSLQAAARHARYRLLEQACVEAGLLHLLLAHTLDDQAETVLMRLSKGSGVDGMAAMAIRRETANVRLLRPLLGLEKPRLRATCRKFRQPWIDDPSNLAPHFARGRLRRVTDALGAEGLSPARLVDTARRAGRARAVLDTESGRLLGRVATVFPEGYMSLDRMRLLDAPDELGLRALSRCLMVIGAGRYPPRLARLEALYDALSAKEGDLGRTLAGCRVIADGGGRLLICREPAATQSRPLAAADGDPAGLVDWDGRFRISPPTGPLPTTLEVRRLGVAGRSVLRSEGLAPARLPAVAALSLPGLWDGERLFAVPKFVPLQSRSKSCKVPVCGARFNPSWRLTDPEFAVV